MFLSTQPLHKMTLAWDSVTWHMFKQHSLQMKEKSSFLWNLPGLNVLFVWKSVSSLSPACLLLPVFIPLKINGKLCFLLSFARVTTMLTKCFIWFIVRIRIWKKHSVCYITICLWWLMYCNDCCLTRHQCFLLPSQHLSMINCHNRVCFQTIYS